MVKAFVAMAIVLAARGAAATPQTEAMATVRQFIDGFNKGDTKSALAACAAPVSVIDEFPPHAWQGPTACADWAADFEAFMKKAGITDPVVTLGKPRHVSVSEDRGYVVIPAGYKYKQKGKPKAQVGSLMTFALQKLPDGWRITGWTWSTGSGH